LDTLSGLLRVCPCGETMDIRLRTVIYSHAVEIRNVPVCSCDACHHAEVLSGAKPQLTALIRMLGKKPARQKLNFADASEWAYLITLAIDEELYHLPIQQLIGDRIDQLLDLLLLSRSLGDKAWEADLHGKLAQITNPVLT
jgi:hypothetical protein